MWECVSINGQIHKQRGHWIPHTKRLEIPNNQYFSILYLSHLLLLHFPKLPQSICYSHLVSSRMCRGGGEGNVIYINIYVWLIELSLIHLHNGKGVAAVRWRTLTSTDRCDRQTERRMNQNRAAHTTRLDPKPTPRAREENQTGTEQKVNWTDSTRWKRMQVQAAKLVSFSELGGSGVEHIKPHTTPTENLIQISTQSRDPEQQTPPPPPDQHQTKEERHRENESLFGTWKSKWLWGNIWYGMWCSCVYLVCTFWEWEVICCQLEEICLKQVK